MQDISINEIGNSLKQNIEKVIIGKSEIIDVLITAMIANGHVLLEDVPGTGKTVLAKTLSKSICAEFKRVQFTPDLLPSDLTGINYYNQKSCEFVFRKGPLFCDILLADEINRATPRTQSSLLECMEEKQISIDGITYKLDEIFFVIATQNPIETAGTFPLPEAQLDRFMVKLSMGHPNFEENKKIIERFILDNPLSELDTVCQKQDIVSIREKYKKIFVSDDIREYIINIVEETHKHNSIKLGISTRGMLALLKMSQAYALLKGREFVTCDDVKKMSMYVIPHRIIVSDNMRVKGISSSDILKEILDNITAPTEKWN